METIALSFLKQSVLAGLLTILVLWTAPLTRSRYTSHWRSVLWLVLCLFLLIPVSWNHPQAPVQLSPEAVQMIQPGVLLPVLSGSPQPPSGQQAPLVPASTEAAGWGLSPVHILLALWVLGAMLFLGWQFRVNRRFIREVRISSIPPTPPVQEVFEQIRKNMDLRTQVRLWISPMVTTPLLMNVRHPVVVLPDTDYTSQQLEHLFLHELTHVRRRDLQAKLLLLVARGIHWFNPLVGRMTRQASLDLELCCDDAVTRQWTPGQRRDYAQTLLTVIHQGRRHPLLSTSFQAGRSAARERIESLVGTQKRKGLSTLAVFLMIFLAGQALVACQGLPGRPSVTGPPETSGSPVLIFEDWQLGYDVMFPAELTDRLLLQGHQVYSREVFEQTEGGLGLLFTFGAFPKDEYLDAETLVDQSPMPLRFLGETDDHYICAVWVSDVQVDPADEALTGIYRDVADTLFEGTLAFQRFDPGTSYIAYIRSADPQTGVLQVEPVEWLTIEDQARLDELGLDADRDLPSGFYVHETGDSFHFVADPSVTIQLGVQLGSPLSAPATPEQFYERVDQWDGRMLARIYEKDGQVQAILEQYTP